MERFSLISGPSLIRRGDSQELEHDVPSVTRNLWIDYDYEGDGASFPVAVGPPRRAGKAGGLTAY